MRQIHFPELFMYALKIKGHAASFRKLVPVLDFNAYSIESLEKESRSRIIQTDKEKEQKGEKNAR